MQGRHTKIEARIALGVLLMLGAMTGCESVSLAGDEVPERRIAVRWFTNEEARRRGEYLEDSEGRSPRQRREGVANFDSVRGYVHKLFGVDAEMGESMDRRFPGRLSLLNPRTAEVESIEAARPGSVPRALSPDGARLMFTQTTGRYRQMFEYTLATGDVRTITREPGVHPDGCYLADGRYALVKAMVKDEQPVATIELTGPGGVGRELVSNGPGDYSVDCAPDGSAIAWVSQQKHGDVLMVRSPAVGGQNRRIGPGRFPAFSPDSQWLVYSQKVADHWTLYRVRPDGSGRKRIGISTGLEQIQPDFSPDGRLIVYVGDDGFNQNLYLVRFDGSGDRVLVSEGGVQNPVW